jgi:hypothetical protein
MMSCRSIGDPAKSHAKAFHNDNAHNLEDTR